MRTCSVCGEEKPNSAFHAEPRVRDGLAAACRLCVKANRKGRHQPGKTRSGSSEQMRARGKVRDAVRYGKLIKPDRCAQCGEPTPNHLLDGHHEDYSKPLDVIWLCRSCHGLRADGGVEGHAGTRPTVIACDTGVEKAATVAPEYGVGIKPGPSEANSPAAPVGDALLATLREHHNWHLQSGPIGLPDGEGGWIEIDNGAEYCDSALYERTAKLLDSAPPALSDVALKKIATEYLSHRGENPFRVLRGGSELWETHVPALRAALSSQPVVRVDQKETPLRRTDR